MRSPLSVVTLALFASPLLAQATGETSPPTRRASPDVEGGSAPARTNTDDWAGIHEAYRAARHAVRAVDGEWRGRNPSQGWRATFDGHGATLASDDGAWRFGLELVRYGFLGQEREVALPEAACAEGQRMRYDWDATLTEWWVDEPAGLEHGFTLHTRPGGAGDEWLSFDLAVRGDLTPTVLAHGRGVRLANAQGAGVLTYDGLVAFDADGRDLEARLELNEDMLRIRVHAAGARYPIAVDPVIQAAYLKASNPDLADYFGFSVAVSGDTVVVGAPKEDSNATGVNGNQSDDSTRDSGAVYVFVRSGLTWQQQAYLKASNTDAGDEFGSSVAICGDTLAIGAPGEDSDATGVNGNQASNLAFAAGAVFVFSRSGGVWQQEAYLKASNPEQGDNFGYCLAISGDTIVVGAFLEDSDDTGVNGAQSSNAAIDAGAAYVFARAGASWQQQAYLKASNTDVNDWFGGSVAISGDTVVVGAEFEDSNTMGVNGNQASNTKMNSGAAYVFERSGSSWQQQAYLKASNTDPFDHFGDSVAVSGETILVGAYGERSNATGVNGDQADNSLGNSGAAYTFVRVGSAWQADAYLKASNAGLNDEFGCDVAISGDTVLIGARGEASIATGINGNQIYDWSTASGAAYLFARNGSNWQQVTYIKASNSDAYDRFGTSVAATHELGVVGAPFESSHGSGVNSPSTGNVISSAGAAYLFELAAAAGTPYCGPSVPNSTGVSGRVSTSGSSSISTNALVLEAHDLPHHAFGMFLTSAAQGTVPQPGGSLGVFCLGGRIGRYDGPGQVLRTLTGGDFSLPVDLANHPQPTGPVAVASGETWHFQAWYRDVVGGVPVSNFTDGVSLTFGN